MSDAELKRGFGKRVQLFREAKGLTQEVLADRIGRSVDTVSNIERGVNATRIEVANLIAIELEVSLSDLFTFDPAPKKTEQTPRLQAVASLLALVEDCDSDTIRDLTGLLQIGLNLAKRR